MPRRNKNVRNPLIYTGRPDWTWLVDELQRRHQRRLEAPHHDEDKGASE